MPYLEQALTPSSCGGSASGPIYSWHILSGVRSSDHTQLLRFACCRQFSSSGSVMRPTQVKGDEGRLHRYPHWYWTDATSVQWTCLGAERT